jgi:hypothetical protein
MELRKVFAITAIQRGMCKIFFRGEAEKGRENRKGTTLKSSIKNHARFFGLDHIYFVPPLALGYVRDTL